MKLQLIITQPTTVDITLNKGDTCYNNHPHFESLIEELGKHQIVGQDTCDWEWKDFFHHSQLTKGRNGSSVQEIRVININKGSSRVSLELKYSSNELIIVILQFPHWY